MRFSSSVIIYSLIKSIWDNNLFNFISFIIKIEPSKWPLTFKMTLVLNIINLISLIIIIKIELYTTCKTKTQNKVRLYGLFINIYTPGSINPPTSGIVFFYLRVFICIFNSKRIVICIFNSTCMNWTCVDRRCIWLEYYRYIFLYFVVSTPAK